MFSSLLLSTFLKVQALREMAIVHQVQLIPPITATIPGYQSEV